MSSRYTFLKISSKKGHFPEMSNAESLFSLTSYTVIALHFKQFGKSKLGSSIVLNCHKSVLLYGDESWNLESDRISALPPLGDIGQLLKRFSVLLRHTTLFCKTKVIFPCFIGCLAD